MTFVLDGSVTLAWCFEDEATEYTDNVLELLDTTTALAPSIWPLEIANALRTAVRRGRLSTADGAHFAELLQALPIDVESVSLERALGTVLSLAQTQDLTSHDACYLDLAMRRGLPLATQDARLRDAAERIGVSIVN
jgi:predicted nucleic acid-binding protein